jgi:hypothetical protein
VSSSFPDPLPVAVSGDDDSAAGALLVGGWLVGALLVRGLLVDCSEVGLELGPGAEVSGLSGVRLGDLVAVGRSREGENEPVMLGWSIAPLLPLPPHAVSSDSRTTTGRAACHVRRNIRTSLAKGVQPTMVRPSSSVLTPSG